jgi:YgiT-type zinc finger domain-containing protein
MKCFLCKGHVANKLTTFMADIDNHIVIIKNVPSQVCSQCGETSYNNDVARMIESIVNDMRDTLAEISVLNYSEKIVA